MSLVVGAVSLGGRRVSCGGSLSLVLVAHDAGGLGLAVVGLDHGAGLVRAQLGVAHLVQPRALVGQREVGYNRERCERRLWWYGRGVPALCRYATNLSCPR